MSGCIIVGEVHGTCETPRAVAEMVGDAVGRGGAVRLALELPAEEEARLAAFVASEGRAVDRAALLAGDFWRGPLQDGRRSVAMVELIESVRRLRAAGADVGVLTFDACDEDRDAAMARRLEAAIRREPAAAFIALAGNLHARKTPGPYGRSFMAAQLVARGIAVITLDSAYGRGTAWVCVGDRPEDCGPRAIGHGVAAALGVVMEPSADAAYDGRLHVGAPTFSPPAAPGAASITIGG